MQVYFSTFPHQFTIQGYFRVTASSYTTLAVLRSSEISPAFLFLADVILFLFLPLDRTICFIFLVAATTLDFHDFNAGFDPEPSVHFVIVGVLVCYRDDLQST